MAKGRGTYLFCGGFFRFWFLFFCFLFFLPGESGNEYPDFVEYNQGACHHALGNDIGRGQDGGHDKREQYGILAFSS